LPVSAVRSEGESIVAIFAVWSWVPTLLNIVLLLLGIFLILLVLIQRGKGGGLAGAFGGAGGSSAFGSRAGDTFMWITVYTAGIWLLLLIAQVYAIRSAAETGTPRAIGSATE
jgi:preprotein translocase subunit SecG